MATLDFTKLPAEFNDAAEIEWPLCFRFVVILR
jgi:hypothetical protein